MLKHTVRSEHTFAAASAAHGWTSIKSTLFLFDLSNCTSTPSPAPCPAASWMNIINSTTFPASAPTGRGCTEDGTCFCPPPLNPRPARASQFY
eukprot:1161037-Pelagomonas_calceolata.AAC.11